MALDPSMYPVLSQLLAPAVSPRRAKRPNPEQPKVQLDQVLADLAQSPDVGPQPLSRTTVGEGMTRVGARRPGATASMDPLPKPAPAPPNFRVLGFSKELVGDGPVKTGIIPSGMSRSWMSQKSPELRATQRADQAASLFLGKYQTPQEALKHPGELDVLDEMLDVKGAWREAWQTTGFKKKWAQLTPGERTELLGVLNQVLEPRKERLGIPTTSEAKSAVMKRLKMGREGRVGIPMSPLSPPETAAERELWARARDFFKDTKSLPPGRPDSALPEAVAEGTAQLTKWKKVQAGVVPEDPRQSGARWFNYRQSTTPNADEALAMLGQSKLPGAPALTHAEMIEKGGFETALKALGAYDRQEFQPAEVVDSNGWDPKRDAFGNSERSLEKPWKGDFVAPGEAATKGPLANADAFRDLRATVWAKLKQYEPVLDGEQLGEFEAKVRAISKELKVVEDAWRSGDPNAKLISKVAVQNARGVLDEIGVGLPPPVRTMGDADVRVKTRNRSDPSVEAARREYLGMGSTEAWAQMDPDMAARTYERRLVPQKVLAGLETPSPPGGLERPVTLPTPGLPVERLLAEPRASLKADLSGAAMDAVQGAGGRPPVKFKVGGEPGAMFQRGREYGLRGGRFVEKVPRQFRGVSPGEIATHFVPPSQALSTAEEIGRWAAKQLARRL